jgi:outer membrane protein assembly factor BamB
MRTTAPGLALALSVATSSLAAADSWPEFRGPTGQGITDATGLPLTWSPTTNVAWKVSVPGKGWSSPSVAAGRVLLTTAVEDAGKARLSLRALAFDAATGKSLWDVEVFAHDRSKLPAIHSKNSHASPTPLIAGDRIYVHFGHLGTACLDLDGKPIWRNTEIKYPPVHGSGGSPILAGKALFFSCDGASDPFVIALDRDTGKELWRTPRRTDATKKFSFSTPLLITVKDQQQIVSPGSDVVCAYDPQTGRELWRARYDGFSVIPRPVFAGGLLFLSTGYEEPQVLAVRADGAGDVTETHIAWTLRRGAPNTPCMVAVGGELYLLSDSGVATCVDAASGKIHWQKRIGGTCSASLLAAEGRIYAIDEDGHGVVFKPGLTFEMLAENDLGERTLASPAPIDGALLLRSEGHLWRIALPGARTASSP